MHWFTNLKTRSKLAAAFGLLIALLLVVVFTAWISLRAIHDAERISTDVASIRNNLNGQQVALLSTLTAPASPETDSRLQEVAARSAENDELLRQAADLARGDADLESYVTRLSAIRGEYLRVREIEVIPLIREGKKEEATAAMLGPAAVQSQKFRDLAREFSARLTARSEGHLRRAQLTFATLGLGALLVAVLLIKSLSRLIAHPLEDITRVADRLAEGELDVEIADLKRSDEVGLLAQSFQRMCRSLTVLASQARQVAAGDLTAQIQPRSERDALGGAFANMTAELRRLTQEFLEAVEMLTSSASEIMASTKQLAAIAAETASAISETTATIEEVKQTSQISSGKARSVAGESQKAAAIAHEGKAAVEQTIAGMGLIRQQMSAIAESILSLSAQSQTIGEIVASVDDLAAQSKLLAVNAAIEAAKAGDEGAGFAVVAQEVRSLAEQSKQATTQVRGILGDIQKATSGAVLATEQGGKAVEAGVRQSAASSESIRELAESLAEAAQAATQIAATSQQQFAGLDQVAVAMESIKTASIQSVASTRQAEAAAQQIHSLGKKLQQLVERFKL